MRLNIDRDLVKQLTVQRTASKKVTSPRWVDTWARDMVIWYWSVAILFWQDSHRTGYPVLYRPYCECLRHRPHVSGNLWKRKFFFTNTACVHTYPAYFPAVSGNFWKRSPEWKFFYPIRIRIRVDGRIRKFSNTLSSFSWIQSSRRAL